MPGFIIIRYRFLFVNMYQWMDRIDDYLMLHMTDFMTPRSFINLSMTSQRFREPMIQTQLKYRIETCVYVEIQGIVQRPISKICDEKHTHLEFVFDTIVFERNITFHTFAWIFNWYSITSPSYIWDFNVIGDDIVGHIQDKFANITLYMSYDDALDEYVIHRLHFSHLTHIVRDDISKYMWRIFIILSFIVIICDPIAIIWIMGFIIIPTLLPSHPAISMIAAT